MKAALFSSIALLFTSAVPRAFAADETAEVIRSLSPDKKFGMRITCDAEFASESHIPAHAIRGVSLVSLPDKKEVASLMTDSDGVFGGLKLIWSSDSKWCAFYSCTNRIGYTSVFRREETGFAKLADENELTAPNDVDTRNEYISPVRWVKPGVLVLQHQIIPRGEADEFNAQFTASYDAKAGKFRIGNVKRLGK